MSAVYGDDGITTALTALAATGAYTTAKMHLYQNNITPATTDVLATYTEATFTGYASQTVGAWGAVSVTAHIAASLGAARTFTLSSGASQTIYGYYLTDSGSTKLLFAERDPNAPFTISTSANTYQITPQITFQSV